VTIPDANLLLYAYDSSSSFHPEAKTWCERLLTGPEPVALLPVVIFGFVRISTHPRVYARPLLPAEAASRVSAWLARPHVSVVDMQTDDVARALELLTAAGTAGNLTSDAQIAAVALRLNAQVHTADLDFGRFAGVRFTNPLK
jgi:uncharacterized protein